MLQERANACAKVILKGIGSSLRNALPPKTTCSGQSTTVSGVSPFLRAAAATTTLNVEPGASLRSAVGVPTTGWLTTARTSPVAASIATSAAGPVTSASTCSPAFCTARSSVVRTGAAGFGGKVFTTRSTRSLPRSTTSTRPPLLPLSRSA